MDSSEAADRIRGHWPTRIVGWYVLSRVLVLFAMGMAASVNAHSFSSTFRSWDATWYLQIAAHGYPARHAPMDVGYGSGLIANEWAIAFMPGQPAFMAALHVLGIGYVAAGLAISAAGGLAATLAVFKIAAITFDEKTAERAAVLFCLFPGAFVFSWVYSEGLALCLAFTALILLLRRHWLTAGLLAALAGGAHSDMAVVLEAASTTAAIGAIWNDRQWKSLIAPALAPLGLVSYMLYLQVHTGSWTNWTATQRYGWDQYIDFGQNQFWEFLGALAHPAEKGSVLTIAGIVFGVAALYALWKARRRMPTPAIVMAATVVLVAVFSTQVGLRPRTLLAAGPLFPALAALVGDRGARILSVVFAASTPLLLIAYLTGPRLVP